MRGCQCAPAKSARRERRDGGRVYRSGGYVVCDGWMDEWWVGGFARGDGGWVLCDVCML